MLKTFFTIFLFLFLHTHTFAMCEKAFSGDEIFTSFVKKQFGENFKHYKDQVVSNAEYVKENWTPEEASQFLDFLIDRVGEIYAAHFLYDIDFSSINPKHFMETVRFYDQVNKNIVPYKLLERSFSTFSNESLIKQRQINDIIINNFGKEVLALMIIKSPDIRGFSDIYKGNHIIDQANRIEEVTKYINSYTKKYGVTTVPLKDRLNTFRQALLPASGERARSDPNNKYFKINNLQELIEVSKIFIEVETKMALRSINKVEVIYYPYNFMPSAKRQSMGLMSFLSSIFFQAEHSRLKKTVHILEQYIRPEEIANLLMRNDPEIYSVDPKNLKEAIDVFIYSQITFSKNTLLKAVEELKEILKKIELETEIKMPLLKVTKELPADISDISVVEPKELISKILRTFPHLLLSANPKNIRDVISILKNSIGEELFFLMNRIDPRLFKFVLLEGNPIHLQKIIDVLKKNFEKEVFRFVVANHLDIINSFANRESGEFTEGLNSFINIIPIMSHHVGTGSNFLRNVLQLMQVAGGFYSTNLQTIHKELTEMNNTKDSDAMKKLLELNIEDWSPSLKRDIDFKEMPE